MLEPSTPVQYVKGIGPRLAEILGAKGIHTVDDLLHYLPFRYEDRLNPRTIAELRAGEMATVIAEVRTSGLFRTRRMPIFQMTAGQGRTRLRCIWFNGTYLKDKFKPGQMVALYGRVEDSRGELELKQPQFEILGESDGEAADQKAAASLEIGRIVPIYETAGQGRLTSRWFRKIIHNALKDLTSDLPEAIPAAIRNRLNLPSARKALWEVHWPIEGAHPNDLRRAVLHRIGPRAEAPRAEGKNRHRIPAQRSRARRHQENSSLSSHRSPETRTERNRFRHAETVPHAASSAR